MLGVGMVAHSPTIRFTAREILILVQLIELAREDDSIYNLMAEPRKIEVEQLRTKLANVK
jgi:hypothetical protein